eukprot:15470365-Alexandrium_andersonii.AAC.1
MAETFQREAPLHGGPSEPSACRLPIGTVPPPDGHIEQRVAARSGAPSCPVRAPSPTVRGLSKGDPERVLKGLCGGGLASVRGVSAMGRRP